MSLAATAPAKPVSRPVQPACNGGDFPKSRRIPRHADAIAFFTD